MILSGLYNRKIKSFDGCTLNCYTNFEGAYNQNKPLFVLSNGLICKYAWWYYLLPFLHDKCAQFVIYEYRGHFDGDYQNQKDNICLRVFGKDMAAMVAFFKARQVVCIGHSMGVNVALEYANNYQIYGDNQNQ